VRADGENIAVGGEYTTAQSVTRIRNETNNNTVFRAESSGSGYGVVATSSSLYGVYGISNGSVGVRGLSSLSVGVWGDSASGWGVYGTSAASGRPAIFARSYVNGTGVLGYSGGGEAIPEGQEKTGIYGRAIQDSGSRGVWGRANAGRGVFGEATSGIGVFASSSTGYALRTTGRLKADKVSGVATIVAGSTSRTVTPGVNVTSGSFVLLTPKVSLAGRDLWFTTDAANNKFTIRMSAKRSSGTKVAWLLLG
jgi:hypothetical protein